MKFYLPLLIILSILGSPFTFAAGRNQLTNEPNGVISFENSLVDFGTIKRGQKMTAKFLYKNTGSGPLIIQGVQAPCDCTTVEASKGKSISPGEGGVIEVAFDSTSYAGRIVKAVSVVTNERAMPDRTLTISALINSDLEADPPLVDFGEVVVNQVTQQQIKIKNLMKTELKIEKLRYNESFLDVGYAKDGKDWVLHVKLKPTAPIGFLKDTIYVKNNSTSLGEMPIPVRATIKGPITSNPAYVEFGSIAVNEKSSRQINLTSMEMFDITTNRIELVVNGVKRDGSEKHLRVGVVPADKNGKKVSLDLTNPGSGNGSVHGKVYLDTTNPQQKLLTIDFYAFFR
ncbi:MAG: DUF1573 domain-containing protein [Proteobacteria bacterium]|nr:DUF1573 domain-containing protein [Pseudomonadota bacterium]